MKSLVALTLIALLFVGSGFQSHAQSSSSYRDFSRWTDVEIKELNQAFSDWKGGEPGRDLLAVAVGTPGRKGICRQFDYSKKAELAGEIKILLNHCTKILNFIEVKNSLGACVHQTDRKLAEGIVARAGETTAEDMECASPSDIREFLNLIGTSSRAERYRTLQKLLRESALQNAAEKFWNFDKRFSHFASAPDGRLESVDGKTKSMTNELCGARCTDEDRTTIANRVRQLESGVAGIPSPLGSAKDVVEILNQNFMNLNASLDKVRTTSNWFGSPDTNKPELQTAYREYATKYGLLVTETVLGPLMRTSAITAAYGDLKMPSASIVNSRDWFNNGGNWSLRLHGGLDITDRIQSKNVELIRNGVKEAKGKLLEETQKILAQSYQRQPATQTPIEIEAELKRRKEDLVFLFSTQSSTVAQVLMKHPEHSSLVCELFVDVQKRDNLSQNSLYGQTAGVVSFIPGVGDASDILGLPLYANYVNAPLAQQELDALVLGGGDPMSASDVSRFFEKVDNASNEAAFNGAMMLATMPIGPAGRLVRRTKLARRVFGMGADAARLEYKVAGELDELAERARKNLLDSGGMVNTTSRRTEEAYPVLADLVDEDATPGLPDVLRRLKSNEPYEKIIEDLRKAPAGSEQNKLLKYLESESGENHIVLNFFKEYGSKFGSRNATEVFTDTEYTGKFVFKRRRSDDEINAFARTLKLDNSHFRSLLPELRDPQIVRSNYSSLERALSEKGYSNRQIKNFLDPLTQLKDDERQGVIRFRKYLEGDSIDEIDSAGPLTGSRISGRTGTARDARAVSPGSTAVEFKMHGEVADGIPLKDKKRFFFSDENVPVIEDWRNFTPENFERTKSRLRADALKEPPLSTNAQWNRENMEGFDSYMEMMRSLHAQKFPMDSRGRVVYQRTAYKGEGGLELTVDRSVRQVDRNTGQVVSAFPWVDQVSKRNFEFDATTGQFVNRQNGRIAYKFDPKTKQVFRVDGRGRTTLEDNVMMNEVKQVELKVPPNQFDIPEGATGRAGVIRQARETLIGQNTVLNRIRANEGLGSLEIRKGKAHDFRIGNISAREVTVKHANGSSIPLTFKFHPSSGKYISWDSKNQTALFELVEEMDSKGHIRKKVFSLRNGTDVREGASLSVERYRINPPN